MIVFDLDGTLVDSRDHILRYNRDLFRWLGRPFPEAEAELFYTLDREALERRFFRGDMDRVAAFRARYPYLERLHEVQPIPGMDEVLRALRSRDIALAVWTNRGPSTGPLLERLRWRQYFDVVLHADCGVAAKPAPDGVHLIAARWRVEPSALLFVGDSDVDQEAARRAGCAFVQVAHVSPPLPDARVVWTAEALMETVDTWLRRRGAVYNDLKQPLYPGGVAVCGQGD